MKDDVKNDTLQVGQRVQLTDHGEDIATPRGVRAWRDKHGPSRPITGTIVDVTTGIFVVEMDGDEFSCLSRGEGFMLCFERHIEPLE
jgi:hypothetical protein